MEEKIPRTIENILQVLSDKFGATGKELWKSLLKQQMIDGVMELIISFVSLIVFIWSFSKASEELWGYWFLAGITLFIFFASLWGGISELLNPINSAVNDILSKINPDD